MLNISLAYCNYYKFFPQVDWKRIPNGIKSCIENCIAFTSLFMFFA